MSDVRKNMTMFMVKFYDTTKNDWLTIDALTRWSRIHRLDLVRQVPLGSFRWTPRRRNWRHGRSRSRTSTFASPSTSRNRRRKSSQIDAEEPRKEIRYDQNTNSLT